MNKKGPSNLPDARSHSELLGNNELAGRINTHLADLSRDILIKLERTIENEFSSSALATARSSALDRAAVHQNDVDELLGRILEGGTRSALDYVSELQNTGVTLEDIYLDLFTPVARRLGEMWESDECSFVDVTLGTCRLQQVLLRLSDSFQHERKSVNQVANALLLPAPGEQHTYGLFMVMEFLRRDGWECFSGTPTNGEEFQLLVEAQDYEVIGISISAEVHLEDTKQQIQTIRDYSRNKDAIIIVGGHAVQSNPSLIKELGADGTAGDGHSATLVAKRLFKLRQASISI